MEKIKIKIQANKIAVTVVIFIVCIVLVAVMLMQFRTIEQTDITEIENMRESELREALVEWKTKYEEVEAQLEEVNSKIAEYEATIDDNEATAELVDEELKESNMLVGKTDVYGPGVIVTLTDTDDFQYAAEDLIELVNELRDGGAEAISINGIRVLANTDIVDLYDYTVIGINLQRTESPYIVKAIGDQEYMSSLLNLKGSGFVSRYTTLGRSVSLELEDKVEIPKSDSDFEIEYMQEVTTTEEED